MSRMVGTAWFDAGVSSSFHPRFQDADKCVGMINAYLFIKKIKNRTILRCNILWPNNKENRAKSDMLSYREIFWDSPCFWTIEEQ